MTRRRRPPATLALLAVIGLTGAGCGSGAPDTGTAGSAGSAGTTTQAVQDRAVRFAECMRAHRVPDFPDANADGEFVFGINVSPAVWQRAVAACKDLQPPGSLSAERSPEEQTASLRFARCMRASGVKDFPDPANGAPLVDTTKIPSTEREGGMTILNAAMQTCRDALDDAAAGQ